MKNKAFTLVELLGVIVVLGIIATITVPLVQRTIIEKTEESYNDQVINFEKAAKNYANSDIYKLTSCTSGCPITLRELQEKGYLPAGDIINPKTDEKFNMENDVVITYDGTKFSYEYDTAQDED